MNSWIVNMKTNAQRSFIIHNINIYFKFIITIINAVTKARPLRSMVSEGTTLEQPKFWRGQEDQGWFSIKIV